MKLPHGTRVLTTARQIDAVSSPLRVEVLEHLGLAGPSSVAELAGLMGRPATAIHYHLKMLHGAGIVRIAGRRKAGRRQEALFELAAKSFAVAGRLERKDSLGQVQRTLRATLRLADREAARAMRRAVVRPEGARRNLHARRMCAPLSKAALRRVNELLDELEQMFRRAAEQHLKERRGRRARIAGAAAGNVVSLTFVLTPVGRPPAGSKDSGENRG